MQVYLPDDLYKLVKARGLPASELLQKAVRAELRRLELLAETDRYVADLVAEVGPPTGAQSTRAAAVALETARQQIREGEGISHEDFWREMDEEKPGKKRPRGKGKTA
ncbi:MAG TPA: hypothetical protein VGM86_16960 [Thermoanaerobaculia bacterium]